MQKKKYAIRKTAPQIDFCGAVPTKLNSDNRIVQQKVNDADVQNAGIIIPAFANVMPDHDFWKRVSGQTEWLIFRDRFFLRFQCVGGLNIGLFAATGGNEIDLAGNLCQLTGSVLFAAVDNADIDLTATDTQFIIEDVFHDVRH